MRKFSRACAVVLAALTCILPAPVRAHAAQEGSSPRYLADDLEERECYEVRQDGTGDFTSIQEAVDSVGSGAVLVIYPGVYEENVVIGDKTIELAGTDRDDCIIMADSRNYHHVPLTIGAGRVHGLTICGVSTGSGQDEVDDDLEGLDMSDADAVYAWQGQYPGYAVHIDQWYGAGKELCIEDCRIISSGNQCVGIGCWSGQTITLQGCELISKGIGGCIYLHNISYPQEVGSARFIMEDCELKNYRCPYVLAVHSMGSQAPVELTFRNVRVSTVAYGIWEWPGSDKGLLGGDIFQAPAQSGLIHHYSLREHTELVRALQEQGSSMEGWPQLKEGITYLEVKDASKEQGRRGEEGPAGSRMQQVIRIQNASQGVPDGWCGLSGIYLTSDSYGNTLPEMNYPRQGSEMGLGIAVQEP